MIIFLLIQVLVTITSFLIFILSPLEFDERLTLFFLLLSSPASVILYLKHRKLRKKEEEFFTLVRDLTLNIRTGMSFTKAFEIAISGGYKALRKEIDELKIQINLGIPIEKSLEKFADMQKSKIIKRSVSIINAGSKSGGKIGEILGLLSSSLLRVKDLRDEMRSSLQVYCTIFYIIYFTYLGIVLLSLFNILPQMEAGGIEVDVEYFRQIFFRSSAILGVFTGLIAGKIVSGSFYSGSVHALLMVSISLIIFIIF